MSGLLIIHLNCDRTRALLIRSSNFVLFILIHSAPRILSQDQRDDRMTICDDLISSADDDPTFLNRIIMETKLGVSFMIRN
ncbi:hypothetical protein ANN_15666 [Periplaneta americana]|uniref:Uncharacterized protein n=1 Tax=Periplaneta americana TaxID=6978 RepID=A0ABQ8SH29_PERAM|nr:hypothetical protein ANN_15666 [Periplaneta americana]